MTATEQRDYVAIEVLKILLDEEIMVEEKLSSINTDPEEVEEIEWATRMSNSALTMADIFMATKAKRDNERRNS